MLEQKKNAAIGMMLGALLVGATAVQASAQATQDTSKAAPTQDTSAYSAPARCGHQRTRRRDRYVRREGRHGQHRHVEDGE